MESEMLEMAELPNQSIGNNRVEKRMLEVEWIRADAVGGFLRQEMMMRSGDRWSEGDGSVIIIRSERMEVKDVGINEWMGCMNIETVRLSGFLCLEQLIM